MWAAKETRHRFFSILCCFITTFKVTDSQTLSFLWLWLILSLVRQMTSGDTSANQKTHHAPPLGSPWSAYVGFCGCVLFHAQTVFVLMSVWGGGAPCNRILAKAEVGLGGVWCPKPQKRLARFPSALILVLWFWTTELASQWSCSTWHWSLRLRRKVDL